MVGDLPELGGWNPAKALKLSAHDYPVWREALLLPPNTAVAFKYLKKNADGAVIWEQDWRYTMATNGCADGLTFKVVYRDGQHGTCAFLAPGRTATVGSGHIGPHGDVDRLELCTGDSTVLVHHDAGFGNRITIRGDVPPLNWTTGRACVNKAPALWECTIAGIPEGRRFTYKVLINDRIWSSGADHTGTGGQIHHVEPAF